MDRQTVEKALSTLRNAEKEGFKGYIVQISEQGSCSQQYIAFNQPIHNYLGDYEFVNAMAEIENEIDKLFVGDCMYFQPNRDDKTSKGIITRVL